jgi:large subunit ribosomal protein L9
VKKVASGYGRNFLIPHGMAVPATKGAVKQAERIIAEADKRRVTLNSEMSRVAEKFVGVQLLFPARAGETGKLYGSITTQMIADQLKEKVGMELDKRQIHSQPLRLLGLHKAAVRLTMDIIPPFEIVVYREGENPENYKVAAEQLAAAAETTHPTQEAAEPVAEHAAPAEPVADSASPAKEAEPETGS